MTTTKELEDFYAKLVECENTEQDCPKIKRNYDVGYVPRGFYYKSSPDKNELPQIKILAVAKNPGKLKGDEAEKYRGKRGRKLAEAHRKFMDALFSNRKRFHGHLIEYLSYFLDLPKNNEVFTESAFTNLVKCSTPKPQEPLRNYLEAANSCFSKHFLKELDLYKPKVVLALGTEVYGFFKKHEDELKARCACLIGIKHPTYYYGQERANVVLPDIKRHIKQCISDGDSFCSYGRFS